MDQQYPTLYFPTAPTCYGFLVNRNMLEQLPYFKIF